MNDLGFGIWNMKLGMWEMECGIWNARFFWDLECGMSDLVLVMLIWNEICLDLDV